MTATKVKPTEAIGDDLPILKWQIKRIMQDFAYQVETKNEYVQWVTGDVNRTSLKSINQAQAIRIMQRQNGIEPQEENWGLFDKENKQHARIQANLIIAKILVKNIRWGEVADMLGWFNRFLKSKYSPVKKPLKQMTPEEVSKIIVALDGVALWKNSI